MGKYSRLFKNTSLVLIGNAGSKLISLLMLPFYTRWLTVENYGLTDILMVYATFLIGIVSCCITESVFIFPKNQERKVQSEYISSGTAFALMMFGIAAALAALVSSLSVSHGIHNTFLDYIWLIYGLVVSQILQQLFQQFTRSIDRMAVYGMAGIIQTGLIAVLSFILIPGWGVRGFVLSQILANILTALYTLILSKGYQYLNVAFISIQRCREMLKYSIPLIPNGIMWWLVGALNRPVMEATVGLHGIGLFAVANKFPGILALIFGVFGTSWQISVLEEYGKEGFAVFYNKVFRIVLVGLLLFFILISLFSQTLVDVFATADFHAAWLYIPILTLGAVFSAVSSMSGAVFSAVRESKYFFYSSIWGAGCAIICNFTLIPQFGVYGAAFSVLFSFMVMSFSRVGYAWRYVRMTCLLRYFISFALACIAALFSIFTAQESYYIGNIIIGFLIIIANIDIIKDVEVKTLSVINKWRSLF